jgi:hypothetical protein
MMGLLFDASVNANRGGDIDGDRGNFNWRQNGDNGRDLGSDNQTSPKWSPSASSGGSVIAVRREANGRTSIWQG